MYGELEEEKVLVSFVMEESRSGGQMWKNVLALVAGTTVALVGVEGSVRLLANLLGVSSYMQYDEQVGWKAKSGAVKRHRDERMGFDVTYSY